MSSPEYQKAVLEYFQAQGWNTNLTELREGSYMIAGSQETDRGSETMLLIVVCEPENQVTADHLQYLLRAGREKNVDTLLLTFTVNLTEEAQEIGRKYGVDVIDSKKVWSNVETSEFGVDTDQISIPSSKPQPDNTDYSAQEQRIEQIIAQAEGSSVNKNLLLGEKSGVEDAEQILAEKPLIEYLYEDESVKYVFWSEYKPFSLPNQALDPGSDYRAICLISDERVLLVVGTDNGDQVLSIPYNVISAVDESIGFLKHRLTITTKESEDIDIYIALDSVESGDEVKEASRFIEQRQTTRSNSVNHEQSSTSNDFTSKIKDRIKYFVMHAVVFISLFLIFMIMIEAYSFLMGSAGEPETIDQHADELVLTLDDLERDGWQAHNFGSKEEFEAASNSSRSSFVNTDVTIGRAAAVDSEVHVFETIDDAEESYDAYVNQIEYEIEERDTADETIMYNTPGTDHTVAVFRDRNTIGIISLQESGFDSQRQITLGGLIGDVRSNYE